MSTGQDWNFDQRFFDLESSADCLILRPSYRMWVIRSTSFYIQMHQYLKFLKRKTNTLFQEYVNFECSLSWYLGFGLDFGHSKILQFLGMNSEFSHKANHLYQKFMTFGRKNTSMMIGIVKEVLTIEIFAIVLIKRNVKKITN